jgi:transaldolase
LDPDATVGSGDVTDLHELRVKIFADGADRAMFLELCANPLISGFTTNPTLMRKAGVEDYRRFARDVLELVTERPVSFEVFADEFAEMEEQALEISSWAENVFVKIPVTNTRREPSDDLLRRLAAAGVRVNVTALMTVEQVERVSACLADAPAGFVSIFAGRIADTGRDPVPYVQRAVAVLAAHPHLELIWASPREVLNVYQADAAGCHVITATSDVLAKLHLAGKDLEEFSVETVQMFYDDARAAGYSLSPQLVAPD